MVSRIMPGNPYVIHDVGEVYLEVGESFTGQVFRISSQYLKGANGSWTGNNANIYAATLPDQERALEKLGQWCNDAVSILMRHSSAIVDSYLKMTATAVEQVGSIGGAIAELKTLDPTKALDKVQSICDLVITLVEAAAAVALDFEEWKNMSMDSIDSIKTTLADKTGTDAGSWPLPFLS